MTQTGLECRGRHAVGIDQGGNRLHVASPFTHARAACLARVHMGVEFFARFLVYNGLHFDICQATHCFLQRSMARASNWPTDCSRIPDAAAMSLYESPWARSDSSNRSRGASARNALRARPTGVVSGFSRTSIGST